MNKYILKGSMLMLLSRFVNNVDIGKLILRLNVGVLMLSHGIYKIKTGIDDISQWLMSLGLPHFMAYGVFFAEIILPLCIILGIYVRSASLLLALNMIVAIFYLYTSGYAPFGIDNYGGFNAEVDFLFLFSSFAIVFLGGGKYGLSALLDRS